MSIIQGFTSREDQLLFIQKILNGLLITTNDKMSAPSKKHVVPPT